MVGHERPKYRHCKQIEDADPDEEHTRNDDGRDAEREEEPEQRDIGDEEMINDRYKACARQLRDQCAVKRLRDNQCDEGRGERPRQGLDAAGDAHLVAQRPQHVIAGEQRKEIGEGP